MTTTKRASTAASAQALVAVSGPAGWVLAAIIGIYLAYLHLYVEWSNLPKAYNLAVAIPAVPAVFLGGWLLRGRARAA
jgi:hypothetical protein